MKRFFLKAAIFLVIGCFIFIILKILADTCDPQRDYRIVQLLNSRDSINVLAVGNSHTCAFDFKTLKVFGYRVAQGGNDVFEAEYQLRALVPMLPNLKMVFFNISYFSLFGDNSAIPDDYCYFTKEEYELFLSRFPQAESLITPIRYSNLVLIDVKKIDSQQKNLLGPAYKEIKNKISDGLGLRKNYYQSIPSFNWVQGDFINFVESKFFSIVRQDHWKGVIYNLFRDKTRISTSIDKYGQYTSDLVYTYKSSGSLEEMAREVQVPIYINNSKLVAYFNKNIQEETYNCLISVVRFLKKRNICIIFITTPVYKSFTDYYDKKYINSMKGYMQSLHKEYGIIYYDFSKDTAFSYNNKFFYNSDHLNKEGAKEFSRKLLLMIGENLSDETE